VVSKIIGWLDNMHGITTKIKKSTYYQTQREEIMGGRHSENRTSENSKSNNIWHNVDSYIKNIRIGGKDLYCKS